MVTDRKLASLSPAASPKGCDHPFDDACQVDLVAPAGISLVDVTGHRDVALRKMRWCGKCGALSWEKGNP